MAGLTYAQIFGTNATLDVTTSSNPKIVIPLEAIKDDAVLGLSDSLGITDISQITNTTKDAWAAKILYALVLRHYQKQPSDNTDNTNPGQTHLNQKQTAVTMNSEKQLTW